MVVPSKPKEDALCVEICPAIVFLEAMDFFGRGKVFNISLGLIAVGPGSISELILRANFSSGFFLFSASLLIASAPAKDRNEPGLDQVHNYPNLVQTLSGLNFFIQIHLNQVSSNLGLSSLNLIESC